MIEVPRRQFLKITGAIAATACLSGAGLSGIAAAAVPGDEVSMLIDTSKCTGCRTCIIACKKWNHLPLEENKFHTAREGRPRFSANQWIDVAYNRSGSRENENGKGKWLYTRISCMHCRDASCVQVCPVGAISHTSWGTVEIDSKRCIGCNYCIANCTFHVVGFDPARNIARKCTFCSDRLSKGMAPACVQACPIGALVFGTRNQITSQAGARVEELKRSGFPRAELYGLKELNGLGMLYILGEGLENSEAIYALPENPQVPAAARAWGVLYKPVRSFLVAALAFALWVNKGESRIKVE
ncbi:MAG: 4Fe-4S dicluster domain-containing protein [Bacillota bacterium]